MVKLLTTSNVNILTTKTVRRIASFCLLFFTFAPSVRAQCYQPLGADSVDVGLVTASGLCLLDQVCLAGSGATELSKSIDGNFDTYSDWNSLVSVLPNQGVAFKTKSGNPYGKQYAGVLVAQNGNTINAALFDDITIALYNDNVLVNSAAMGNLLTSSGVLSGTSKTYAIIKSTGPFDEIRFTKNTLLSANSNIRLHEAFVFDEMCNVENNQYCADYIQGPSTNVMISGGLLSNVGGFLSNPQNMVNGNSGDYAVLSNLANALTPLNIGIVDRANVYPAGNTAGFVIEPGNSSALSLDLLQNVTIKTFLHGVEQDTRTFSGATLINLTAVASTEESKKQKISLVTTKPFNEVRLIYANSVAVTANTSIRIYGAYEEPATCGDCIIRVKSTGTTPSGTILDGGTFNSDNDWTGAYGLNLSGLTNQENVVDANEVNYAVYSGLASLGGGVRITTQLNSMQSPGTFAGYEIGSGLSLLDLSVLGATSVKLYKGENIVQTMTGEALAGLNLLSLGASGTSKNLVGFVAKDSFNRVMIEMNAGVSLLGNIRFYSCVIINDIDKDGVPDCIDNFPTCDNNYDDDGDGIPNDCDYADLYSQISLVTPVSFFRAGDTLTYKVQVRNNGIRDAQNVVLNIPAPPASSIYTWTATPSVTLSNFTSSGTGDIVSNIAVLPNGATVDYEYRVVTNANYNMPSISASFSITEGSNDPTPNCDICKTPPLPRLNHPDLVLSSDFSAKVFKAATPSQDFVVRLQEVNNVPSYGTITLKISKKSDFTITFSTQPSLLSYTLNNSNWTFSDTDPNYYTITTSSSNVSALGILNLGFSITFNNPNNTLPSQEVLSFSLENGSGGDRTNSNNTNYSYLFVNF